MRTAWLIARREIVWEVFGDRGSLLRSAFFVVLPVLFVISARGTGTGPRADGAILTFAFQSTFVPALTGVALIAATFTSEKENQTLVPLLAAPIRDLDILVGKLIGMLLPVTAICIASLAVYYGLASALYGHARVARVLPFEVLYAAVVLAFLYVLTAGSWVLIFAARVRTSRAAQQMAGLVIGLSIIVLGILGAAALALFQGWGLVALGLGLVASDVVALEIARRAWQREETVARI